MIKCIWRFTCDACGAEADGWRSESKQKWHQVPPLYAPDDWAMRNGKALCPVCYAPFREEERELRELVNAFLDSPEMKAMEPGQTKWRTVLAFRKANGKPHWATVIPREVLE